VAALERELVAAATPKSMSTHTAARCCAAAREHLAPTVQLLCVSRGVSLRQSTTALAGLIL
jgi:hypothetical protein